MSASSPAEVEQQRLFTEVDGSLKRGQMRKAERALDERAWMPRWPRFERRPRVLADRLTPCLPPILQSYAWIQMIRTLLERNSSSSSIPPGRRMRLTW